ncbi:MAG: hypothetical protein R3301_12775, partial [Saprospiraceae bacterium]|nr:hypothetical protein [Saprospiraceae bacterium]
FICSGVLVIRVVLSEEQFHYGGHNEHNAVQLSLNSCHAKRETRNTEQSADSPICQFADSPICSGVIGHHGGASAEHFHHSGHGEHNAVQLSLNSCHAKHETRNTKRSADSPICGFVHLLWCLVIMVVYLKNKFTTADTANTTESRCR